MLKKKKILIIGIRNKWSIAYGIANIASQNNAELIFLYRGKDNEDKIKELVNPLGKNSFYSIEDATDENEMREVLEKIKKEHGVLDGIVHAIAHANTEDLHNDFLYTSQEGFLHALNASSYSFVMLTRLLVEKEMLKEKSSILTLTYYGSNKVLPGYNVMGIAKAALESSVRYLAENLGKYHIRVNALSAGPIKTISAKGIKDFNSMLEIAQNKSPIKENITLEEIGNVATFLLSDMSSGITGQVIYVDNGYSIMGL